MGYLKMFEYTEKCIAVPHSGAWSILRYPSSLKLLVVGTVGLHSWLDAFLLTFSSFLALVVCEYEGLEIVSYYFQLKFGTGI